MASKQLIGSYVHIREKPREQHALLMLRKIASLVKPIMVSRGFTVGCLAEFYPAQHNLLGLNIDHGRKICIRLRQPYDENAFLELEDCVYTMLHELTHNLHGPHDEVFHAYLKGLEDEYIAARIAGYNGEGFYSEGNRLGAGRAPRPSTIADARRRALAAAEKRHVQSNPGSTQRLGSSSASANPPERAGMRERIASAALRRIRAPRSCGGESGGRDRGRMEEEAERAIRNGFRTQAEAEEADEAAILRAAIELIEIGEREEREEEERRRRSWMQRDGYVWIEDEEPVPVPAARAPDAGARHSRSRSGRSGGSRHVPIPIDLDHPAPHQGGSTWACNLCTLINPTSHRNCDACGVQRTGGGGDGDIQILDAPPGPRPPGGLRGASSGRKRERVRFGINPVTPARRMWDCGRCRGTNDVEWPACAGCGAGRRRVGA
ncbi:WLM-domain-containing protein [Morchella conica CCBAS932]|uniref:WLM-domain-containing protein n=1 Tax=Morchella conica CCBAS932 TaxID=1392247 RepID=A0A3N4KHZ9_9PEZI|nr:WLM-domain-containing protein [Morchella conica CCBAS932]